MIARGFKAAVAFLSAIAASDARAPMILFCRLISISCCWLFVLDAQGQSLSSSHRLTANSSFFSVASFPGGPSAVGILDLCDATRVELQRVWGNGESMEAWQPRCQVVVHPSRRSYLDSVGPGAGQTTGSSFVQLTADKVSKRRIDLLLDRNGNLSALAHEMTHVVLADYFGGQPPPAWFDEGIAMLADTREKQLLHFRDCREALYSGTALSMDELLGLAQLESAEQAAAFYGQSLSLVQMLINRDQPHQVIDFALEAARDGYEVALKKHYGIKNINDLERRWRNHSVVSLERSSPPAIIAVSFQP